MERFFIQVSTCSRRPGMITPCILSVAALKVPLCGSLNRVLVLASCPRREFATPFREAVRAFRRLVVLFTLLPSIAVALLSPLLTAALGGVAEISLFGLRRENRG